MLYNLDTNSLDIKNYQQSKYFLNLKFQDIHTIMDQFGKKKWEIINDDLYIKYNNNKKYHSVSQVIRIKDLEGTYILKELPSYCSNLDYVNKILEFQRIIVSKNIPIPPFFKTVKGKNYVLLNKEGRNFLYTLQEFIPGTKWMAQKEQIEKSAILLASFHQISKELYSESERIDLPYKNIFDDIENLTNIAFTELSHRLKKPFKKEEENSLIDFFKNCGDNIIDIKNKLILNDYRSIIIYVHGDFNPSNLIFNCSDISAVIDFDNCGIDNPINDIIRFILHICYFNFDNNTIPDFEVAGFFLRSYFQHGFLKIQNIIEFFPLVLRAIAIELSIIYILRGYFTSYQACHQFFDIIKNVEQNIMLIINRDLINE